jgi:four helix bundle protein
MAQQQFQPLRDRAFRFAVEVVHFCRALPTTWESQRLRDQLFRAGTAIGANYQAAGRGRSDREFIAKMAVVVEESDETCYWLRLLAATGIARGPDVDRLSSEATELLKIFSASLTTAKANRKKRRAATHTAERV